MKKILHILSSNSYSGAENVVFQICLDEELGRRYEFIYCSPVGDIGQKAKSESIHYFGVDKISIKSLREAVEFVNPDIIHAHDPKAILYASLLRLKNIPIIFHVHTNLNKSFLNKLKGFLLFLVSSAASSIIWVSRQNYDNFLFSRFNSIKEKSEVLENTIRKDYYLDGARIIANQMPTKDIDIIFLGRFEDVKDPMRALKIIERVLEKKSKVKIFFVGDGSLMDEMKNYVIEKSLDKNVFFTGKVSNPIDYLIRSKIFLMTSIYEGRPMAALEAMMCGNYIVSTPTDGIIDLVSQSQNGYLSENDEELVVEIDDYLTNFNTNNLNTIDTCFDEVNNYSKYIKQIDKLYKQVEKGT